MTLWNDRPEAWHEILPGVKRRILAHGDGVMVVLLEIAPKTSLPNHTHPHAQAGTFLEGEGVFYVGNETYRMRKGSAYSIPGGVPHGLLTGPEGPSLVLDVFVPERQDFLREAVPADQK
ncbi:MAG: cupin domain-containing protein [Thermoplasmata archaeon]